MDEYSTPSKLCRICGEIKPLTEFHRHKKYPDGRCSECKECRRQKSSEYYEQNKEAVNAKNRARYAKDPERHKARSREWYQNNFERSQASKQKYYAEHRTEIIAYVGRWKRENPDKVKASRQRSKAKDRSRNQRYYQQNKARINERGRQYNNSHREQARASRWRRKALMKNAPGKFTTDDIKTLYKMQKGRCWYCQKSIEDGYHIDHRIPLSRGGTNDPSNLVLTCPFCNLSKNDRLPHEWGDRLL